MPINSLCSDFFTTGWLKQAYDMSVNPVPEPEAWDIGDDVRNRVVLPWKKKRLTGRPKKNRMPSVGEKRKQQTCGNCGHKGHNKKSCSNPSCSTGKPEKNHVLVACARKKDITNLHAQIGITYSTPVWHPTSARMTLTQTKKTLIIRYG
jgi:hypothetical protein